MLSTRVDWLALPADVRNQLEHYVGTSTPMVTLLDGGFSPGFLARIEGANGRVVFAKLCSTELNARTPTMHAREAEVLSCLPEMWCRPQLLATVESPDSGWSGLITTFVEGKALAASPIAVDASFAMLQGIAGSQIPEQLVPLEARLIDDFLWFGLQRLMQRDETLGSNWSAEQSSRLLSYEQYLMTALSGDELVHGDMRADNVIVEASGKAVAVDWPAAARGNAAFDAVILCASIAQQGGPPPGDLLARNLRCRSADFEMITVLVVGWYGHYAWASTLGNPPGIGGVRRYQASMAKTLEGWLVDRLR
jgi:hypothetical protein